MNIPAWCFVKELLSDLQISPGNSVIGCKVYFLLAVQSVYSALLLLSSHSAQEQPCWGFVVQYPNKCNIFCLQIFWLLWSTISAMIQWKEINSLCCTVFSAMTGKTKAWTNVQLRVKKWLYISNNRVYLLQCAESQANTYFSPKRTLVVLLRHLLRKKITQNFNRRYASWALKSFQLELRIYLH